MAGEPESNIPNFDIPDFTPWFSIQHGKNYSSNTQRWKGIITGIQNESFTAELHDLSTPTSYELEEFDFDEVSPEDQEYISIGGVFYWSVGIMMTNGQRTKESIIRFQRLVKWSEKDFDKAADRASELNRDLTWQ